MKIDSYVEMDERKFRAADGKIPCYVYMRVSTQMQDFERQQKILRDYINKELGAGYYIKEQFLEKISGADANRPEYKRMWNGLKARQAKVVIAPSMDRFGRKLSELLKAVERAKEMDIELRFIKDHITINNNDSVTQTLTLQILGAVAEFESSVASERVKQKVDAKRENPFWWTGQKPRITGETWCDMVDMYYAKKPATMGGRDGHLTDRKSNTKMVFKYTTTQIADHFKMSKGAFSDVVKKYVSAGIMPHRSPKMARKASTVDFLGLDAHTKQKGAKKGSHSILHPHYWPKNIVDNVSKKFGDYKKIEKFSNRENTLDAWKFGKKVYYGWMKAYVKESQENADIFASHSKLLSGGNMGGIADVSKNLSQAAIKRLDIQDLADSASKDLETKE
jgi:DNA invertase Pin-like site-specific DNA recombinase